MLLDSLLAVPEWDYLTCRELGELLQLNQQTIRNMVNAGQLDYVQRGRAKCIPRTVAVALVGGTGSEMPEMLTVAQVAELLQLSKQSLWNWIEAGTFPAVQIGRRFRIKRSDLNSWLDSHPYQSANEFWGEDSGNSDR